MAFVTVRSDGVGSPDYTSLAAAIAASETEIEIQGTWASADTANHALNYGSGVTIKATGAAKHPGYVGASPTHWRSRVTSGHVFTLTGSNSTFVFEGLDIGQQSVTTSDECFRVDTAGITVTIRDCLCWFDSLNTNQDVLYVNNRANCTINVENSIWWGASRNGIFSNGGTNITVNIVSCTMYDMGFENFNDGGAVGIKIDAAETGVCNVFNSLLHSNAGCTGVIAKTGSGTLTGTYDRCITNRTLSDSWYGHVETESDCIYSATFADTTGASAVIFEDLTAGSEDFRLQDHANNIAQEMHSDGSGAGLTMPATDILGTTRTAPYCCGAVEIGETGPTEQINLTSAVIPAAGTTIELNFDTAANIGTGGNGGWTLNASGGACTMSYSSGDTTTQLVYTLSRTIEAGETITVSYVQPGDGIESNDGTDLASITDDTVTNNSTYTPAGPITIALTSAVIPGPGNTIRLNFDTNANIGAGGNGGWTIAPSGGASTLTYVSGDGSPQLIYSLSRAIEEGETLTVSYTQPGNGVESDDGTDLANITAGAVTNASAYKPASSITISSATIPAAGNVIQLTFSAAVSIGVNGSNGWTLNSSGAASEMLYAAGAGTTQLTYNLTRTIQAGETITVDYVNPGDGLEDAGGRDIADITAQAVTNSAVSEVDAATYSNDYTAVNNCDAATRWSLVSGSGITPAVDTATKAEGTGSIEIATTQGGSGIITYRVDLVTDTLGFSIVEKDFLFWFYYVKGKAAQYLADAASSLTVRLHYGNPVDTIYVDYYIGGDKDLVFGWKTYVCSGKNYDALGAGHNNGTDWNLDVTYVDFILNFANTTYPQNGTQVFLFFDELRVGTKIVCAAGTSIAPETEQDLLTYSEDDGSRSPNPRPLGVVEVKGNLVNLTCGLDLGNGTSAGHLAIYNKLLLFNQLSTEVEHPFNIEDKSSYAGGILEIGTDGQYPVEPNQIVMPAGKLSDLTVKPGGSLKLFNAKLFRFRNIYLGSAAGEAGTIVMVKVDIDSCETVYMRRNAIKFQNVEIHDNSNSDRAQAAEMTATPAIFEGVLMHDCVEALHVRASAILDRLQATDNTNYDLAVLEGETPVTIDSLYNTVTKLKRLAS